MKYTKAVAIPKQTKCFIKGISLLELVSAFFAAYKNFVVDEEPLRKVGESQECHDEHREKGRDDEPLWES
jgi:hypothetical protein